MTRHFLAATVVSASLGALLLSGCTIENSLAPEAFTHTSEPTTQASSRGPSPSPEPEESEMPSLGARENGTFEAAQWAQEAPQAVVEGMEVPGCYEVQTMGEEQTGRAGSSASVAVCTETWAVVRGDLRRTLIGKGWVVAPSLEVVAARTADATRFVLVRPSQDPTLGLVLTMSAVQGSALPVTPASPGP